MSSVLIRNARLVNEGREFDGDLLVSHGRIVKIASSIEGEKPLWKSTQTANGCCQA